MARCDIAFAGTALVDSIVRDLDPVPVSATGYRAGSGILSPGGEAVNGALAARKLGLDAAILCALGRDPAGDLVAAALEAGGVNCAGVLRPADRQTPVSTLLVNRDGTRRSITNAAHRASFHPERHLDRLPEARVLVLGSLFRAPFDDPASVRGVLEGFGGSLRYADTKLPNFRPLALEDLKESLPRVDCIFPNQDEAAYCTGQTDPEAAADVFLRYGVKSVVVKLGAGGCLFKNPEVTVRLAGYAIDPVDATGAGDSFLAGFAAARLAGEDLPAALRFANACGAICTTAQGAAGALRDRDQVLDFIRARPDPVLWVR